MEIGKLNKSGFFCLPFHPPWRARFKHLPAHHCASAAILWMVQAMGFSLVSKTAWSNKGQLSLLQILSYSVASETCLLRHFTFLFSLCSLQLRRAGQSLFYVIDLQYLRNTLGTPFSLLLFIHIFVGYIFRNFSFLSLFLANPMF